MKRLALFMAVPLSGFAVVLILTAHMSTSVLILAMVGYLTMITLSLYGWLRYQEQTEYFALEQKRIELDAKAHRESELLNQQLQIVMSKVLRHALNGDPTAAERLSIANNNHGQVLHFRSNQRDGADSTNPAASGPSDEESAS